MKIFVPVAWPYANGELHLGHFVGCFLPADIFAAFHRQKGSDVLMVSGSDMHGTPTEVAAEREGVKPEVISNRYHKDHLKNLEKMGVTFNLYTNTDTEVHKKTVQKLFLDLYEKGYLVKKTVKQYWSEKEKKFLLDRFIEGECPHCSYKDARGDQCDSCGRTLEPIELKNPHSINGDTNLILKDSEDFFLELGKLQKDIENWLAKHPYFKKWRDNVSSFTKAWLKEGLKSRPITRDLSYGVPLPKEIKVKGKENKVIYVWFEAVTGYWSAAIEWSKRVSGEIKVDKDKVQYHLYSKQAKSWRDFLLNKACKHYYFMGKDNIVFHTIIWPAMLLGWNKDKKGREKMQLAYDVPANAFLTLEGGKMSKSRKWFVGLKYLIDTYGQDLVRFYFAFRMPENKDSDFRWSDFYEVNNSELVGNLGNFIHRTLSFVDSHFDGVVPAGKLENEMRFEIKDALTETEDLLEDAKISEALQRILKLVAFANRCFDKKAVWKVIEKDKKEAGNILFNCIQVIEALRVLLMPYMPQAMGELTEMLGVNKREWQVRKDNWKFERIKPETKLGKVKMLFKKLDMKEAETEKAKLGKGE